MGNKRKDKTVKWLNEYGLLTLVLTALTIGLQVVFSFIIPKLGNVTFIISLLFILSLVAIISYFFQRPLINKLDYEFQSLGLSLKSGTINWLVRTKELAELETSFSKKEVDEIWLVTSDLLDDALEGPFFEVVQRNLKKKIRHVYFAPKTPEIEGRYAAIANKHGNSEYLNIIYLPTDFFFLVTNLDIVVYNPLGKGTISKRAFLGLPTPDTSEHYHAEVNNSFTDTLIGHLIAINKAK